MLPVVAGERETKKQILLYTVLLLPVALVPWWIGTASIVWGILSAVMGVTFIALAIKVWLDETDCAPRQMFRYSLVYLSVLFAALIVESLVLRMLAG